MKDIIDRLEQRHPIWEENNPVWREINDVLFDHVKRHVENYIERGDDEEPSDYERRIRFARFKGELAPVLHRLVGAVMSRPPTRPTELQNKWSDFIDNCDGCQNHLDQFLEDRLFEAFGFGASFILIDRPSVDEGGMLTETTSNDFKPAEYNRPVPDEEIIAVPYKIDQIVDWSTDRCGEFNWVRICEKNRRAETSMSEATEVTIYREFDRTAWRVFEVREAENAYNGTEKVVELLGQGVHDLGIVPLAIVGLQKDKHMCYYSPMKYAYHHDIANYISDSDLQYSTWRHAHPTLVDYTSSDTITRVTVGPGATIRRNPEYNEEIKYLDFPKSMGDHLRQNKEDSVSAIKRISGLDPLSASSNANDRASGRSRAVAFSVSEERHLRRAAKALSTAEKRIFEIAERWTSTESNVPPTTSLNNYRTNYPLVFSNAGTEGTIEQWLATRTAINSETYDKEMQKKIVDSALGDISRDQRRAIHEEIDANSVIGEEIEMKNDHGEKGENADAGSKEDASGEVQGGSDLPAGSEKDDSGGDKSGDKQDRTAK